jgi:Ras-related protein Rab-11A
MMHGVETDYEYLFKVIIVGESGVGKSNIMHRFLKNEFFPSLKSTIGVDFGVKKIELKENVVIKVQIWDTAGQERYRAVVGSYYKNAQGAVLVYDISSKESFNNLPKWIKELRQHTPANCKLLLIGNKKDLVDKREVQREQGEKFANENGLYFMETSAKDEEGGLVNEAMKLILTGTFNTLQNKRGSAEQKSGNS